MPPGRRQQAGDPPTSLYWSNQSSSLDQFVIEFPHYKTGQVSWRSRARGPHPDSPVAGLQLLAQCGLQLQQAEVAGGRAAGAGAEAQAVHGGQQLGGVQLGDLQRRVHLLASPPRSGRLRHVAAPRGACRRPRRSELPGLQKRAKSSGAGFRGGAGRVRGKSESVPARESQGSRSPRATPGLLNGSTHFP